MNRTDLWRKVTSLLMKKVVKLNTKFEKLSEIFNCKGLEAKKVTRKYYLVTYI